MANSELVFDFKSLRDCSVGNLYLKRNEEGIYSVLFPVDDELPLSFSRGAGMIYMEFDEEEIILLEPLNLLDPEQGSRILFEKLLEAQMIKKEKKNLELDPQRGLVRSRTQRVLRENSNKDPIVVLFNDVTSRANVIYDIMSVLEEFNSDILSLRPLVRRAKKFLKVIDSRRGFSHELFSEFYLWHSKIDFALAEIEKEISEIKPQELRARAIFIAKEMYGDENEGLLSVAGVGGLRRSFDGFFSWSEGDIFGPPMLSFTEDEIEEIDSFGMKLFDTEKLKTLEGNSEWLKAASLMIFVTELKLRQNAYLKKNTVSC